MIEMVEKSPMIFVAEIVEVFFVYGLEKREKINNCGGEDSGKEVCKETQEEESTLFHFQTSNMVLITLREKKNI